MGDNFKLTIKDGFAVLEFDQPESKANILSESSLKELNDILQSLKNKTDIKGLCVASKKENIFIAGADIKEIEKITVEKDGEEKAVFGQNILNILEDLPFPTIALINGACLGGGLELALACDYRLAGSGDKIKIGLPEVNLGILPGFGGTKRLPRLTGLRKGLELIAAGKLLSPESAYRAGLIDGIVSSKLLVEDGISFLKAKNKKRKIFKPPVKGPLNKLLENNAAGRALLLSLTKKNILKKSFGKYPAPIMAAEVAVKNYAAPLKEALNNETKAFGKLVITDVSKNLVFLYYLQEKYKKAGIPGVEPVKINKCAVLGAGIMGGGIAQIFSFNGLPVRMKDINFKALGMGLKAAFDVYKGAVKRRKIKKHNATNGMALISTTLDFSGFSNADLIVEAVVEDLKIKQEVFKQISDVAKPTAILATNTSCIPIKLIEQNAKDPARIAGLHFFNPVHRMPLIEVIRSDQTSDQTVATLIQFSRKIGKTPIVVRDSWGFLVNRLLIPSLLEAGELLEEGVGFERIDKILMDFGLPMGAFILLDEIGLDVGYKVAALLEQNLGSRMKVPQILQKVYEKKWLGKKTSKGFYIHKGKSKKANNDIYSLFAHKGNKIKDEDILKRIIYRMISEAALCLDEKVCEEASDIDIGMVMGTGFPPFRGGLLRYCDTLNKSDVSGFLKELEQSISPERFAAFKPLKDLAAANRKFYSS